ncbi:hypothetical protein DCD74_02190 [Lysobacter oculi]|uniref:Uncharacterized protein n=2 Tax=Solilutibacter oculi TaxID=2698682 RepID=A0A344J8R0_9GAMM|nr:hypothetical protein DCD74_02190 [Lysobacter oculi]
MRNSAFAWIALATGALLFIPFVAMRVTTAVNWGIEDFVVMGILLFAAGSIFVLVARKVSPKNRLVTGVLVLAAFLYVWAELAVGIFTNLGS